MVSAKMLFENEVVEVELQPNSEVVGILLDNGQRIEIKIGSYREYIPLNEGGTPSGPPIYMLRSVYNIDTLMVGFVRNIIATDYHSPWTPK